ncbi:MAG: DUF805 domain-containing protein [Flectobacillus sp.]|uniref:DUF805 domain-containing protein n=1 Tax=Flectobacillus sp. TaxID=50419 RepID=UPI003B994C3D
MFKNILSFEGRIRRLEYGLSIIFFIVGLLISSFLLGLLGFSSNFLIIFTLLPLLYFRIAQAAKRCHDLGNSGWYQLIPLYSFWLLLADGEPYTNEYGIPPKALEEIDITELGKHLENEEENI